MDNETFKAIRVIAFADALSPDYAFLYRRICRWYSREFSTSLATVKKLPDETVLQEWFEDQYDHMVTSPEASDRNLINETRVELLKTIKLDDGSTLEDKIEAEDDLWHKQMLEEIKRDEELAAKRRVARKNKKGKKGSPSPSLKIDPNLIKEEIHVSSRGEGNSEGI